MRPRDIAQQLSQQRRQKQDTQPWYRAEIVNQRDSTGEDTVDVENRPYFVWVRLWSAQGNVVPAYNVRVAAVAGLPVLVSRMPGSESGLEIIGLDIEIFEAQDIAPNVGLIHRQHAASHEWPDASPGLDAVTVYPRSWAQLRTYPQDPLSLLVNVSPLVYAYGNTMVTFDGAVIDLTAVEATLAVGEARLALVYLDLTTNTLAYTNGTIGADAGGWALDDPAVSNDTFPSAVVRIAEAQTEISEDDIRDRRMFLNILPGDSGNWPYNTEIVSVDSTDPDADYDNISDAVGAVAATEVIVVSPEQFTCGNETLPANTDLIGWDKLRSILFTNAANTVLTLPGDNYLRDVQVYADRDDAGDVAAIDVNASDSELEHVIALAENDGAGDVAGITVDGAANNIYLTDVRARGVSGNGGSEYGLYVEDGGSVQRVQGGWYDGDTADVYVGTGSEAYLYGPILEGGVFAGPGDRYGWHYDGAGNLYTYNANLILEDNVADALSIDDGGGIEYIRFDTRDAQPATVFNDAGADIDWRAEAVGQPNALFVRGSDGLAQINVGLGVGTMGITTRGIYVIKSFSGATAVGIHAGITITDDNHMTSLFSEARYDGAGAYTKQLQGYEGRAYNRTTQTVALAHGVQGAVYQNLAGTITTARAFVTGWSNPTGTIINAYGIFLGTTVGTVTNPWGVYQAGANDNNYFAAKMAIGGTVAAAGQLHVDNASVARPVLYLDQGDVSEEMIEYATTIGVGNAIEAVGGKTLTVTHFIKVALPGGLTRYHQVGTIA